MRSRALSPPFPFEDLWAWRGYWQAQGLGNYQSRRNEIANLARPAREALETTLNDVQIADPGASDLPSWAGLDQRIAGIIAELAWPAVTMLCRTSGGAAVRS